VQEAILQKRNLATRGAPLLGALADALTDGLI